MYLKEEAAKTYKNSVKIIEDFFKAHIPTEKKSIQLLKHSMNEIMFATQVLYDYEVYDVEELVKKVSNNFELIKDKEHEDKCYIVIKIDLRDLAKTILNLDISTFNVFPAAKHC